MFFRNSLIKPLDDLVLWANCVIMSTCCVNTDELNMNELIEPHCHHFLVGKGFTIYVKSSFIFYFIYICVNVDINIIFDVKYFVYLHLFNYSITSTAKY